MGLTILGNKTKTFEKPIYIIKPFLSSKKELYNIIDDLFDTRMLSNNGYYLQKFKEKLKEYLGVKHVILVSSATLGLQLLFKALNLKGEVILPSFTFAATPQALLWEGLKPVFADIEPEYCGIDINSAKNCLTKDTSAVIGVNLFGNTCDINGLTNFCKKNDLKLIFDSAQGFASKYNDTFLGNFGDAEVFSLHATKILHSLEGGFITTSNDALAQELKCLRNFGFTDYDKIDTLGINAKMNEFSAAVGSNNLKYIHQNMTKNTKNIELYNELLKNIPGIRLFNIDPQANNYHTYQIYVEEDFGLNRDELYKIFWEENVIVRRYYYTGCHKQKPFQNCKIAPDKLPVTDKISSSILSLPCYPDLCEENIKKIVNIILEAKKNSNTIKKIYQKQETVYS